MSNLSDSLRTNCVMADLIGKTIEGLALSWDKKILVVKHNQGKSIYQCVANPGSRAWLTELSGVETVLGRTIFSAVDVDVEPVDDLLIREDYDEYFAIRLTTCAGALTIVYRISSNEQDGGDFVKVDHIPEAADLMSVESDL